MDIITQTRLATDFGKRQGFISELKTHRKYTTDPLIAIALSNVYGEPAIEYINPRKRHLYLRAYPELEKTIRLTPDFKVMAEQAVSK